MPRFSIIVPVYNVEKYLAECVSSVLNQTYKDYEIILVNDGSTDSSAQICNEYSEKYNFISVQHQTNQGLSEARNTGIRISTGEYLVFLDSDDFLKKDALEVLSGIIEKHRPEVIINNYYLVEDGTNNFFCKPWKMQETYKNSGKVLIECSAPTGITLTAWSIVVERKYLMKHGLMFYPGIKHEDELWTPQVIVQSDNVILNGKAFYCYRTERAGSIVKVPDARKLFDKLFVIDELIKFSKSLEGMRRSAIEQRCSKILTGVIRDLYTYRDTKEFDKISKGVRERLWVLKFGPKFKYKVLYIGCLVVGNKKVSEMWNR